MRRPVSDGVSGETSLFSLLNKTENKMEGERVMDVYNELIDKLELYYSPVKCVSEPITQTG